MACDKPETSLWHMTLWGLKSRPDRYHIE